MLELERLIDAAVGEAPPADFTRVERILTRRRRRRALTRTAAVSGLVVAVAAIFLVPRDESTSSITTRGTTTPTTRPSPAGIVDFSTAELRRGLETRGHTVRVVEPRPGDSGLLGARPTLLCVDEARGVQVYEYASDAARRAWSRAISRDGGSINRGNRRTEVLWIAPPHFFARGKVIALYLGSDEQLIADLASVLGPTLDPNAPQAGKTREQPC